MDKLHSSTTPELGPKKLGDGPSREVTFVPSAGNVDALMGLAVIDYQKDPTVTLADELRGAVDSYVARRTGSPTYQHEVHQAQIRQAQALGMLNTEKP